MSISLQEFDSPMRFDRPVIDGGLEVGHVCSDGETYTGILPTGERRGPYQSEAGARAWVLARRGQ